MKQIYLSLALACFAALQAHSQQQPAHLSGISLKEDAGKEIEIWNDGVLSLLGNSANRMVNVVKDGHFDVSFPIDSPAYYRMGYNVIYLAPGDSLSAHFSDDPEKTVFTGTVTEVNNYMRGCLGSHSGSFVGIIGQRNLGDLSSVEKKIDSLATVRRSELKALKSATPAFREMENARITGDIINTYFCIPFYSGMEDTTAKFFLESKKELLCPLIGEISKDKYLDVEVVRSVLFQCAGNSVFSDCIHWTPRMKVLYEAAGLSNYLSQNVDEEGLAYVDSFLRICPEKDIQAALQIKRKQADALMKGSPAIDLNLTTPEGTPALLSSYKGKAIYIDLWATWCGPCLKESPAFHRLAEKYKDRKDIVFLSVSTDAEQKRWLAFLKGKQHNIPEYLCADNKGMRQWGVESIPRFILIDKDFKIFNAHAPRPSSGEHIEKAIRELTGNN